MIDDKSWQRIARYALGECSAEEAVETRAWIDADPERRMLADELVHVVDSGAPPAWNADSAWQRFRATVAQEESVPAADPTVIPLSAGRQRLRPEQPRRTRRWTAAAAAAVVLLASSLVTWHYVAGPGSVVAAEDLRSVATRSGQTSEIYLSDGTRVVLAAASTLRFPERFRGDRGVYLEGEAYFDVADDRRLPFLPKRDFTVHTERAVARDLGTRFSVSAHPTSSTTDVVVEQGAVALAAGGNARYGEELVLSAGDLGRLDEAGTLTAVRGVDVQSLLGWMDGRLVFTDAPAEQVAAQFERWFGVRLQFADSALAAARLTATFDTDAPAEALDMLAVLLDAGYEREGPVTVLRSNHSGR